MTGERGLPVGRTDVRVAVLIPAAGRGSRLGGSVPKQYRDLRGRAILWHTLMCFQHHPRVHGLILVVHPEDRDLCDQRVLGTDDFDKLVAVVDGGAQRGDSVRAGFGATTPGDDIILVHDAVRPMISGGLIDRVVDGAIQHGAVIPALPVAETVKVVKDGVIIASPDRRQLWRAQTPQGFQRLVLETALNHPQGDDPITDEAMLVERAGNCPVRIIDGEQENEKITTADDLERMVWRQTRGDHMGSQEVRVGTGFDVHRLVDGRALILGGIDIPHSQGLAGHSDADVLVHAIIDALLGAAGLGDIGRLFPDSDPAFEGISSLVLLERVGERLAQINARVQSIDAVIMAQVPRLSPHIDGMTCAVATVLGVAGERISIKATTTEGLGFVGREEGMAAQAVALLYLKA